MTSRRGILVHAGAGALALGCLRIARAAPPAADEVTPVEDLMREHGVLRRVMYLYDETIERLDTGAKTEVPRDALVKAARIVRHVIEDYHERLEENHVFPRFERAHVLDDLTTVLRRQHEVGRGLTDQIIALALGKLVDGDRPVLRKALHQFNHMYRAHAAREDTVLFPALRGLVGAAAYGELGEQFEDEEKRALGDDGFEHAVADVAALERAFGVDDLAKLTTAA
jgi:hemerythrin-like domain-containing protein